MKLAELKLDTAKIDNGEWMDVPGDPDGLAFLVRGRRSKEYKTRQGRMLTQARKSTRRGRDLEMAVIIDIDNRCVAKECLLGWKNLIGEDGKEIEYDKELAEMLMTEREYEPFQEAVKDCVDRLDGGDYELMEEIEKNS